MDTRESAPAVRNHGPTGDDTMQMATTLRRSTHTFLTHLFGPGHRDAPWDGAPQSEQSRRARRRP